MWLLLTCIIWFQLPYLNCCQNCWNILDLECKVLLTWVLIKVTHVPKVNTVTSVIYVCVCKFSDINISIAVTTNTEIAEHRTVVMYPFMILSVQKKLCKFSRQWVKLHAFSKESSIVVFLFTQLTSSNIPLQMLNVCLWIACCTEHA